jgi:hypothetical protein
MRRTLALLAIAAACLSTAALLPAQASVSVWTRITSPQGAGGRVWQLADVTSSPATLRVAGQASPAVTAVNFYCFYDHDERTTTTSPLNSGGPISVINGAIPATTLGFPFMGTTMPPCVLRALPSDYSQLDGAGNNSGYVAAFSGPGFYWGQVGRYSNGSLVYSFEADLTRTAAATSLTSAGQFGIGEVRPVDDAMKVMSPGDALDGSLFIDDSNAVATGSPTRSALLIDGRSVFFPYRLQSRASDIAQVPNVTVSSKKLAGGDVLLTEHDPLRRCSNADYPSSGCIVAPVGVELVRTTRLSRGAAIEAVRDRFTSTDHKKHTLRVEYTIYLNGASYGDWGVKMPGRSFRDYTDTTMSTPVQPHTVYVTNDSYAQPGDPNRVDTGFTYSAHPQVYFTDTSHFVLRYSRTIRAGRFTGFGFDAATSTSWQTADGWVKGLLPGLREHVSIRSPKRGATVGSPVRVRGRVTNPVNGYPTTVLVRIGTAKRRVGVATDGTWSAQLPVASGRRVIHVTATDPAGITLTATRTVRH